MKDRVTPFDEAPPHLNDTGTPLTVTDALGRVVAWSADAARLVGLGAGEAVGRPVTDLLGTDPHWLATARTSGAARSRSGTGKAGAGRCRHGRIASWEEPARARSGCWSRSRERNLGWGRRPRRARRWRTGS
ncbi:PAS domain-containing protein [Streptomyces indonesiensis]